MAKSLLAHRIGHLSVPPNAHDDLRRLSKREADGRSIVMLHTLHEHATGRYAFHG